MEINVIADTNGFALLGVYAGLRAFAREHSVPIRFKSRGRVQFEQLAPGALWIELHEGNGSEPVSICIDLADAGSAFSLERLEQCDLYFKRSFDAEQVARLPGRLSAKVKPYGVFYEAMESADVSLIPRFVCELIARKRFGEPIGKGQWRWWARLLGLSWLDPFVRTIGTPLAVEDHQVTRSDAPLGNTICFQTRMWAPEDAPHADTPALNEGRAEVVRALKRHFGPRFVGGVVRSPYAEAHYSDLITTFPHTRAAYLKLVQECRVSVVTTGIHRSIPGKLGESLAAGRCIVTDPLAYELPSPLEEGRHYLVFTNSDECVAHCDRLLTDDAAAAAMQARNREYFERHGALTVTIDRCLRLAEQIGRAKQVGGVATTGVGA